MVDVVAVVVVRGRTLRSLESHATTIGYACTAVPYGTAVVSVVGDSVVKG
jgi:hypothetical protein